MDKSTDQVKATNVILLLGRVLVEHPRGGGMGGGELDYSILLTKRKCKLFVIFISQSIMPPGNIYIYIYIYIWVK